MPTIADLQKEYDDLRQKLNVAEARFHNIVSKNADGMIIADRSGIVRFHNPAAVKMFNNPEMELTGRVFGFPVIANETAEVDLLRKGKSPVSVEMRVVEIEWEGEPMFLASLRDITDRKSAEDRLKSSLKEKEVLLREIHHRVKNNLEVIISLIEMQSACIPDKTAIRFFNEIRERIWVIARVHEDLYHSDNLSDINFRKYLENLTDDMLSLYDLPKISVQTDFSEAFLDIETAIPCGLIYIELLTNALKHAFPKDRVRESDVRCQILCGFIEKDGMFILTMSDNGIGMSENSDWRNAKSMGLRLVNILTKQLNGHLDVGANDYSPIDVGVNDYSPIDVGANDYSPLRNGTAFKISFPISPLPQPLPEAERGVI